MVKISSDGCSLYSKKVTFTDNGSVVVQYTDNPNEYTLLGNKFTNLSNIVVEDVVGSVEQLERLDVLNTLDLELVEYWSAEVNDFVINGYIEPETTSILASISSDYTVQSKEYIIRKLTEEIAEYRYFKEVSGVDYDGMLVKTDRESQGTISATLMSFLAGLLTTIDFKFKNGWKTFDATTFPSFAKVVGAHVSNSFVSENIVANKLTLLTLEELLAKDEEGNKLVDIKEMFDNEYLTLITAP